MRSTTPRRSVVRPLTRAAAAACLTVGLTIGLTIGLTVGAPARAQPAPPPPTPAARPDAARPDAARPDTAGDGVRVPARDVADSAARAVHARLLTVDAHLDLRPDFTAAAAAGETDGQFDLPKLERGALDVPVVALFGESFRRTPENRARARAQVDGKLAQLRAFVAAHPDRLAFARSADDVEQVAATGRHAVLLSFLNTLALRPDTAELVALHAAGVRVLGFAHVGDNDFAHSSRPSAPFGDTVAVRPGLTALGRTAVGTLNRLGVVVDVSQLTRDGVLEAVRLSRAPVVASHSALRSRVDNARNLTVEEARLIAERGGVVHVVAFGPYLRASAEQERAYRAQVWAPFGLVPGRDDPSQTLDAEGQRRYGLAYRAYARSSWRYWSLDDYLDAVDAAVRLLGVDHVGLSSDFNHGGGVAGFSSVADAPNVTAGLLRRGYSEADLAKLWGGNFLRVLRAAEATAAALAAPAPGAVAARGGR